MADMKIVVAGAGGRMGRALINMVTQSEGMHVIAALDRTGADVLGADAGTLAGIGALGVAVCDEPLQAFVNADAVLDFTAPKATVGMAELAAQARMVHVIGTTGLSDDDHAAIAAAARHARIVQSGNMSLGVNLLAGLVRRAAAALGPDYDVEVLEMHHRHKIDAPSGTALLLGAAAAQGRGIDLDTVSVRSRDGITGPRPEGAIGFAALRGGSVVGDHTVILAGEGERIELSHKAENRTIYTRGAVCAARWAFDKKPGLYTMADVLGMN
ncbi:MAG: 4-hydroxy-tetrahydrodipicolinate reductase [Alphaproteobacteria bacterium]